MIPVRMFAEKHVAVFGLGRSGMAAARSLRRGGAQVIVCDDNDESCRAAIKEGFNASAWNDLPWGELEALILSPGVPLTHPEPHPIVTEAMAYGVDVIGDVELLVREVASHDTQNRVVAITGTNGKSTTTALTAHILKHAGRDVRVGGNIGEAVLGLAEPGDETIYVLEISSYQMDLTPSLAADVAVLLNVTPDHLERHGGMSGYVNAKRRIFSGQGKTDTAIISVDDRFTSEICTEITGNGVGTVVPVSVGKTLGRGVYAIDGILFDGTSSPSAEIADLTECRALTGAHNWQNAAAAYSVAKAMEVPLHTIVEGLLTFPGLPHRLERVGTIGGVAFVNDSKATNVDATARALECYDEILWIAGGRPKGESIDGLAQYFPKIKKAYLIGEASEQFSATLSGQVDHEKASTLSTALDHVMCDLAQCEGEEPVVLFSPACASFDQYDDFEARGDAFRYLVEQLQSSLSQNGAAA